ncbi:MAG: hypothetical protein IKF80_06675 [Erysipelotrichaceae bacterium]|nr:hypothetical protein [Erysipelotrichaceae bacterium]
MDYPAEERFVRTYIRKSRQERLLYELKTTEKRYRGLSRFSHQARELIDNDKILKTGKDFDDTKDLEKFVKQHDENCLVFSPDPMIDDSSMSLKEAIEKAKMSSDALIILGTDFAIVFAEADKNGRDRFLLTEKSI